MTGLAKRVGLAALAIGIVAASAGRASAGLIVYDVNLSVPFNGNSPESLTAVGTITLNATGTGLGTAAITDYSITISSPNFSPTTLVDDPSDSIPYFFSASLTATADSVDVVLPPTDSLIERFAEFGIAGTSGSNTGTTLDFQGDRGADDLLALSNGPQVMDLDGGSTTIGGNGGTYLLGTAAVATPEPSTLVLMITGGLAGRRRRSPAA